jgi:hypothetical protein
LKTLKGMAEHGDLDKQKATELITRIEKDLKEDLDAIGPKWTRRQKTSKSYAGVNVYDLADSLGMSYIYHSFYRPANPGVHGADARKHIAVQEKPDGNLVFSTTSSPKGVAEALVWSSIAMVEVLAVANKRLGLGIEEKVLNLGQRINKMALRLPEE